MCTQETIRLTCTHAAFMELWGRVSLEARLLFGRNNIDMSQS